MKSFPPAVISWSKLTGRVSSRAIFKDGQLSIINAHKKDSGLYRCEASNSLGQDSALTQLVVVELPRFTISPPAKLNVFVYNDITVPCQATGDPKPTIRWKKENGQLPSGRSKIGLNGTLEIWSAKEEDSGRYTCIASSNEIFAKATLTMELTVAGKKLPTFTVFEQDTLLYDLIYLYSCMVFMCEGGRDLGFSSQDLGNRMKIFPNERSSRVTRTKLFEKIASLSQPSGQNGIILPCMYFHLRRIRISFISEGTGVEKATTGGEQHNLCCARRRRRCVVVIAFVVIY